MDRLPIEKNLVPSDNKSLDIRLPTVKLCAKCGGSGLGSIEKSGYNYVIVLTG